MQKLFNSRTVIFICLVICLFISTNIHWGKNKWRNIIEADAKGYYAYLPAVFIYHDLNFGFYDSIEKGKYYDHFLVYDYRATTPDGKLIDKYFCGTAIAQSPFFLIAHFMSYLTGDPTDGYSEFYLLFITLAALFYLFIGLLFIDKLLRSYDINNINRSFTLISILFGTNLFFYSICEMGMSHVYSFAFISMFCFFTKKYFQTFQPKELVISMIILGMIFLIRPVNILVLFSVPFLAGSIKNLTEGFVSLKKRPIILIFGIVIMLFLMSIQSIIYKVSTGYFWVDSYPGENFNFKDLHFIDILFSYKKGLFLYTPMYLIALTGIYFLYKNRKFEFFAFSIFFVIITYVLSSWWSWWYGGSFSSRVYVEYLPLFAVVLSLLIQNVKNKIHKAITSTIIILLILLCQFQTYQYRYYIIHWEDMTKEKYWNVFLKLNK